MANYWYIRKRKIELLDLFIERSYNKLAIEGLSWSGIVWELILATKAQSTVVKKE